MNILAIDTSCDETSAAVTKNNKILSNIVWSQASQHAKFGGVVPSLARRKHIEKIDFIVKKALSKSGININKIDAIAVTAGPGLAIALEVGINKAKELSIKFKKPLIAVNHIEGHLLSPFANTPPIKSSVFKRKYNISLIVSGGHTEVVEMSGIGKYKIIAQTVDDALGECLDKGARMLGLGYPGGAVLEKMAKNGDKNRFLLPTPLAGQENRLIFSYSGLKTALYRSLDKEINDKGSLSKKRMQDVCASYQNAAFRHIIRILKHIFDNPDHKYTYLLIGGGVGANVELRKRIRKLCKQYKITPLFPYSKKLYGDNAAMIGVAAYYKTQREGFDNKMAKIDRNPNLKIDE